MCTTVLVDADIDEGAEGRNVRDHALENHSDLQIGRWSRRLP